ncbi:MAG: ABC transporter permease [Candidatus Omnitrophica bacterium]|nr:ABC transporter permease [Candidatus Omnitrophota bacterium]
MNKIAALLKKDFLLESSYKFSFIFNIIGIFSSILIYFFIDKLFGYRIAGHLKEFGVNYFAYVLLGMAFFSYIGVGLGSFSERIRLEQTQGTLEAIFLTPTKVSTILVSLSLWNLIFASFDMFVYIILGIYCFNINFSNINILSSCLTLILTIMSFSSLGILSASFVIVFKRGNPVSWFVSTLEGLLGGVYFPITVLPGWLQFAAKFFPITYSVRAMELSVYRGYSAAQLFKELSFLLAFTILLLPLSVKAFQYSLKKARRDASLTQY